MKPFHCEHCGHVLGQTDNVVLKIGEYVILDRQTRLLCAQCGAPRRWKPVEVAYTLIEQSILMTAV